MFSLKSYHGGVEEDENSWAQQSCGAQEVRRVGQTQQCHKGPPGQQTAHRHSFAQPLAVTGADVDQLEQTQRLQIPLKTPFKRKKYLNGTAKTIRAIL